MGIIHRYEPIKKVNRFLNQKDLKTLIVVLVIEFVIYLLVDFKGYGSEFFPVTLLLMALTAAGSGIAAYYHADRYLLVIVLLLMNIGFAVQVIEHGAETKTVEFCSKFFVAILVALSTAFFYHLAAERLAYDSTIRGLMVLQIAICAVMTILGKRVGDTQAQGAVILLAGMTPFELVKIIYPFVAAGLIGEDYCKNIWIFEIKMKREVMLLLHTVLLIPFFVICNEFGTLLVILFTFTMMMWVYGENRKLIRWMLGVGIFVFLLFWILCDRIFYPQILSGDLQVSGALQKLIERFGCALHPEKFMSGGGYQGCLSLEAIAIGGTLGMDAEWYRLPLPESSTDFVFSNVVQTCGFFMGLIVILFFFGLIKRGMVISENGRSGYFRSLSMAITLVIGIEAIIHIGHNLAIFPITGIPLYFVSQGFTAIVTGVMAVTILLVLSTDIFKKRYEV